jgi:hypothetical protein
MPSNDLRTSSAKASHLALAVAACAGIVTVVLLLCLVLDLILRKVGAK